MSPILLLVMVTSGGDIGHLVKTIVGLVTSSWDVYSDVDVGLYHYYPKNVTRYLENSTVIPDNCVSRFDSTSTGLFECLEKDMIAATITFAFIFMPSLSFAIESARLAVGHCLTHGFDEIGKKGLLLIFFFLLVPFPVLVIAQHLASLFIRNEFMEYQSTLILMAEGSMEAAPQLTLQIYFILSDAERKPIPLHFLCLTSSFIIINKSSIELFLRESLSSREFLKFSLKDMFKQEMTNQDSLLKGRSLLQKLWLMAQFSPAFLLQFAFNVWSISIFVTLFTFENFSLIYLLINCISGFVSFFFLSYNTQMERYQNVFHYGTVHITLLKHPTESRKECFPKMMTMAITRLILYTLILIVLMIWFLVLDPSTHLTHWSDHRFFFHG